MRITVDIPASVHRELKILAATEGTTMREIILESLDRRLHPREHRESSERLQLPLIRSKRPGSLKLGEEGVYEYIPFP
jgi:hypothetical protein